MVRTEKAPREVDNCRCLVKGMAKNLADRLWGPDGPAWGTKLSELEDIVVELRQVLSEKMLSLAVQRQADTQTERPLEYRECLSCHQPPEPREPEPRLVKARGGEVEWKEPHDYCSRCRRAFFPSDQKLGH